MDKEYMIRIIEGRCTEEEHNAFFDSLASDEELSRQYSRVKNEYVLSHLPYSQEGLAMYERPEQASVPSNATPAPKGRSRALSTLVRIAAILAIPLFLYFIYDSVSGFNARRSTPKTYSAIVEKQHDAMLKYYVNPGTKGYIDLPDGSKVWLNSGSQFEFPARFDGSARTAVLDGEGYFEIVSNKEWPFFIKTPAGITLKITGTSFNLSCYKNDPAFKLTMVSGILTLQKDADLSKTEVSGGEEIVIPFANNAATAKSAKHPEAIHTTTAWKDGELIFDDTPMDEVIRKLERWYGVEITVNDPSISRFRYTAEFKSESINQVLDAIKITSKVSYSIDGKSVTLY